MIKLEVHKNDQENQEGEEIKDPLELPEIPSNFIDEYNQDGRIELNKLEEFADFDEENIDFDKLTR